MFVWSCGRAIIAAPPEDSRRISDPFLLLLVPQIWNSLLGVVLGLLNYLDPRGM